MKKRWYMPAWLWWPMMLAAVSSPIVLICAAICVIVRAWMAQR